MRSRLLGLVVLVAAASLRAQSSVPAVSQQLPPQNLVLGGDAVTVDLRNYFTVPGVAGTQFAQMDTIFGKVNVELRNDAAPRHVANFLAYVRAGAYNTTFIHRSAALEAGGISIVQGGGYGYRLPFEITTVPRFAAVALEYNLPNARGTLAAARASDVNSATSEWYFNVRDNSSILNQSNNGGYSVFGRVMGTGMTVIDSIAAVPRFNAGSPFNEVPLVDFTTGNPDERNLVIVRSVSEATLFPTGGGASIVEFAVENSAPSVATHVLSGSTLTLRAAGAGTATLRVRASDANGNAVENTFAVAAIAIKPEFLAQPIAHTAAAGSTIVFHAPAYGAASYTWRRDGVAVPGGTASTLVIPNVAASHQGEYTVVAASSAGETTSQAARLAVVSVASTEIGRLINLSLLTTAGSGARILTMGASVGSGGATEGLPLVIRAVGPTLAQPPFNVPGVLADPVMNFYSQADTSTPLATNDDWGGSAALAAAFTAVGAFTLPADSRDSAIVRSAPGVAPGGYSVQVSGKGSASGSVIAEIYDASGASRTAATPRLINLSTLSQIDAGSVLSVGFALRGQTSRTVLIRGVGPSLAQFNVEGRMADPQLELYDNDTGRRIALNYDWAGDLALANAATAVGAFALGSSTSRDAALLLTLPPGLYSARISGTGNTGGTAIVEVYEVP